MAKYKSMLKTHSVGVAGRKRKCYHDDAHSIQKGHLVLEVKDGQYKASFYCTECALHMINQCRERLNEIEDNFRQRN